MYAEYAIRMRTRKNRREVLSMKRSIKLLTCCWSEQIYISRYTPTQTRHLNVAITINAIINGDNNGKITINMTVISGSRNECELYLPCCNSTIHLLCTELELLSRSTTDIIQQSVQREWSTNNNRSLLHFAFVISLNGDSKSAYTLHLKRATINTKRY